MNDIVRRQTSGGQIEVYNASQKLTEQTERNLEERGTLASQLLVASLTESPYTPVIGGVRYGLEVSNRYVGQGAGDEADGGVPDTVDEARIALAEFISAKVPGARRLHLPSYSTQYSYIWRCLKPGLRATSQYKDAFEEAFVESSRRSGVEIPSPEVGKKIIKGAPRKIRALAFSDHRAGYSYEGVGQRHDAVTEAGHIVTVYSRRSFMQPYVSRFFTANVHSLGSRGGRAPGSTIPRRIEKRVIDLRTRHTKA